MRKIIGMWQWMIENSHNVIFIFIVNYLVMYIIGFNFVGGFAWYALSGEYAEALDLIEFASRNNKNYIWAITAPSLLLAAVSSLLYLTLFFIYISIKFVIFRQFPTLTVEPQMFWVFISSLWLPLLIMYFLIIRDYFNPSIETTFRIAVVEKGCFSVLPVLLSGVFWFIIYRLRVEHLLNN